MPLFSKHTLNLFSHRLVVYHFGQTTKFDSYTCPTIGHPSTENQYQGFLRHFGGSHFKIQGHMVEEQTSIISYFVIEYLLTHQKVSRPSLYSANPDQEKHM